MNLLGKGNPSLPRRGVTRALDMRVGAWGTLALAWVVAIALGLPGLARADEPLWERLRGEEDKLPERLMIRGGWAHIFDATTRVKFPGDFGVGTTIDFEEDLGGEDEDNVFRLDASFRFNPRHRVGFSWYNVDRSAAVQLPLDLVVDDTRFLKGSGASTTLNIELYRALYWWSFYRSDKVELSLSPGLYIATVDWELAGALGVVPGPGGPTLQGGVKSNEFVTVPLPSIGGQVNYRVTPRLHATVRGDVFFLKVGTFEGNLSELYAGLEYRLFKYFGVGAAYNWLSVDAEDDATNGWKLDNNWNMIYAYGSFYFFDL